MNANLGFLAYFDGRWDEAIEYYERARTGAQRIGNIGYVAFPETNIGEVLINQRRFDEASERLTDAVRLLRATGEWSMATFAELLLARIELERGDIERAASELEAVKQRADAIGYATVSTEAAIHLADCDLRRGNPEGALEALERIMDEGGEEADEFAILATRIRGRAMHELGRSDSAVAVIDQAIGLARDRQLPYDLAMSLLVRSDLADGTDVEAEEEARALIERLGIRSATNDDHS
jgi:ATP/maltotriose-dependent transcriptional regulator MalT